MAAEVLIIGVGNEYLGDDGVGLALARMLMAEPPPGTRIVERSGDGAELLDTWRGVSAVIVLDAVDACRPAGAVVRLDARREPVPARLVSSSTHALGLAHAIELSRALGESPDHLIIYGVQGTAFAAGTALSAPVASAMGEAERSVRQEVMRLQERLHPDAS